VDDVILRYGPGLIGAALVLVCVVFAIRWRSGKPVVLGAGVAIVAAVAEIWLLGQQSNTSEPGNVGVGLMYFFSSLACSLVLFVAGVTLLSILLSRWSLARRQRARSGGVSGE
jgi:hypothetical protein